jgi:hypothetical protein
VAVAVEVALVELVELAVVALLRSFLINRFQLGRELLQLVPAVPRLLEPMERVPLDPLPQLDLLQPPLRTGLSHFLLTLVALVATLLW